MTVLVTGATGFIGQHVINELLKSTNFSIIATSRDIEKAKKCSWFNKVEYVQYDINFEAEHNLFDLFHKPDILVHLAWEGLPNYKDLIHLENNLYKNYCFLKNLVVNGLKNISVTGTCFEYGMVNGALDEKMNTQPTNSYALAKDTLRRYIEELQKNYDFNFKWIRLFYMYGKGQSEKSILSLVDNAVKSNDKVFNMSGGEQLRDYLHVSDVALNIVQIIKQNKINGIINCCSGQPISIRSLVENYLKKRKYEMNLNLGYYPYPDYEPMSFWGNNMKMNKIKGNENE